MEEKKRKKAKKKNRSAQSDYVPIPTFRDLEGFPSLAALATAGSTATNVSPPALKLVVEEVPPEEGTGSRDLEGAPPLAAAAAAVVTAETTATTVPPPPALEEEVCPEEGTGPAAEPSSVFCLREEFQQAVQELRSISKSEIAHSTSLRVFLEDLKTSHATSQANFELLIEELRKEVFQLNQSARLQKNKEVDLDGDIQRLREDVSQVRAMQEAQEERKTAELAEIRQLREEIFKLSEGSVQQLRKVEEMSITIQQLLLERGQAAAPMDSYQLGQNHAVYPAFASQVGITSSPETPEQLFSATRNLGLVAEAGTIAGDSHFPMEAAATMAEELVAKNLAFVEKVNEQHVSMEHPTQQHNGMIQLPNNVIITHSSEAEKIVSLADYLGEKNLDAQMREVSTVDSLYSEEHAIEKGSLDDHGPIVDKKAFVNGIADFKHTREEKNEHYHAVPNMIHSDLPQRALMQADNELKPFSDAPITGAPIRLLRFVARYVSGADLVNG